MMHNPYDVHTWSKLYREERLAEASRRHLDEQASANKEPRESGRLGLSRMKLMVLLRRA